jgi:hypothetical protein
LIPGFVPGFTIHQHEVQSPIDQKILQKVLVHGRGLKIEHWRLAGYDYELSPSVAPWSRAARRRIWFTSATAYGGGWKRTVATSGRLLQGSVGGGWHTLSSMLHSPFLYGCDRVRSERWTGARGEVGNSGGGDSPQLIGQKCPCSLTL